MARKKKMSKEQKILVSILTIVIVILLIAAIIFISVKGMWSQVIDYLTTLIEQNQANNSNGNDPDIDNPSGDIQDPDIDTPSGDIQDPDIDTPSGDINNPDKDDSELVPDGTLEMKVLDIGQGDCILITFPDGQTMVMDIGSEFGSTSPWNVIDSELKAKGITTIDYMFLTHTDYDHSREVDKLCENYEIKNFYMPRANLDTSATWEDAYNAAKAETYTENGQTFQATYHENIGMFRIETESWRMKCYSFDEEDYPNIKNSSSAEDKNGVSPICLLEYADRTIVLTGDATIETESYMISKGYLTDIDADILKVGHHGSAGSTSDAFLDKIDCEYAIVSVGADNDYGHPAQAAVDRLVDYKDVTPDDDFNGFAEVYYTDEDGTITVQIDETGAMSIKTVDSPDKDVNVAGTIQSGEINESGQVALTYYKQDEYAYVLA